MRIGGISRATSRYYLVASLVIFAASEVLAYAVDLWLMANQSGTALNTYNSWLGNLPGAINLSATICLVYGALYLPIIIKSLMITMGVGITAASFVLGYVFQLSFKVEYYPGYYLSLIDDPVATLFYIGMGLIIGTIFSMVFHDFLSTEKRALT